MRHLELVVPVVILIAAIIVLFFLAIIMGQGIAYTAIEKDCLILGETVINNTEYVCKVK